MRIYNLIKSRAIAMTPIKIITVFPDFFIYINDTSLSQNYANLKHMNFYNVAVEKLLKNDRGLLFAYDHGFEYGPGHFDERSVEPTFALELANSGHFTGFICQKGIAARYY